MSGISQILVSSSDVRIDQTQNMCAGSSDLVKGQILQAQVVQTGPHRRVQLMINGKMVQAETYVPLRTGDRLVLKVAADGPQQILKLMAVKTRQMHAAQQALYHASSRPAAYTILSRLLESLHSADTGKNAPEGKADHLALEKAVGALSLKSGDAKADFLKELIKGCGLSWEAKLKAELSSHNPLDSARVEKLVSTDLKALALRWLGRFQDGNENLVRDTTAFLDGLERLQILNRYAAETSNRYILPLPVLWGGQIRFGQMLIDLGDRERSSDAASVRLIRVAFCLEMSNLGNIQADFAILKRALSGTFSVADNRVRMFVEDNLAILEEKLENLGFSVHGIRCQVMPPETLAATNFMDRLINSSDGLLNVLI